jgi:tetratricopeptide (TPR) repeat protein
MFLGNCYCSLGKYVEAEEEYKIAVNFQKRTRGPDQLYTLNARRLLADVWAHEGRWVEAEKEQRAILASREKLRGADHDETMTDRYNLAVTLLGEKKFIEAEKELRSVVTFRTKNRGPSDLLTMDARNSLADALRTEGKYAEAEAEMRDLLEICEKAMSSPNPAEMRYYQEIAAVFSGEGRLDRALLYAKRSEAECQAIYGPDHPFSKSAVTFRKAIEEGLGKKGSGQAKETAPSGPAQGA